MAENMMVSDHKATNKPFRDNYDRTFRNSDKKENDSDRIHPEDNRDN